ncbi:response regulator [Tunturiibacter gelidoferens]|uniref:DNA-binding NarL/FixJ family response regulator n=2 Tax=Tunturiibacter TaxID=3154218 RepID=A0A7Y9NL15_9BACT|nr:response regulator transcription factor [Edaphobacter lichenicola]MBB5339424.1 DNA-binding NarL/FixJ family response regulator [Edaphobacter lichenicola]NYF51316.1 DNA-binding NarL/FixJ family response regulator [Edaphobacter lichenicola]
MIKTPRIRILCIDDHPIVRDGLISIVNLQPDMEIVGAAGSGAEGLSMFRDINPDITLVDLRLRDTTGFDLIRNILELSPSARTIVLTSFEGDVDIERALAAGARGYVVKGMVREELLHAIRAVHAGKQHVPSAVAAKLVDHLASEKLTQRELDVLKEVARGKRNKEIGATLSIAEDTVKMHVKNILMKLGVNDRTEAVTNALRRGIIHLN